MKKHGSDPKVKKTLIRNYESKPRKKTDDNNLCLDSFEKLHANQDTELTTPSLCSSEAFANYLADVKKSLPPPKPIDKVDSSQVNSKITKKLNFHFNDRIYRNLVELNTNIDESRNKKEKRPSSGTISVKKDLEPNIEDFYEDEKEKDILPNIPIIKPKFKPIRKVEDGQLHNLIVAFENI